jgi:hypothetical protein
MIPPIADPPVRQPIAGKSGVIEKLWWDWFVRLKMYVGALALRIFGTPNQVIVTDNLDGSVTLSTPQDIHTEAVPTFNGVIHNGFPFVRHLIDRDMVVPAGYTAITGFADVQADITIIVDGEWVAL